MLLHERKRGVPSLRPVAFTWRSKAARKRETSSATLIISRKKNIKAQDLKQGIELDDGITSPADVRKSGKAKSNSWLEITIHEGKKHQIKRMVEACGHRVMRIKRIGFGPLQLRNLPLGSCRYATDAEANALRGILRRTALEAIERSLRSRQKLKNRALASVTNKAKAKRLSRE